VNKWEKKKEKGKKKESNNDRKEENNNAFRCPFLLNSAECVYALLPNLEKSYYFRLVFYFSKPFSLDSKRFPSIKYNEC
jgi:hypothetical protein